MRLLSLGQCASGQTQGSSMLVQMEDTEQRLSSCFTLGTYREDSTFKSLAHVTRLETFSLGD